MSATDDATSSSAAAAKRRRVDDDSPKALSDAEDNDVPYVTLKERREQKHELLRKMGRRGAVATSGALGSLSASSAAARKEKRSGTGDGDAAKLGPLAGKSLLEQAGELKRQAEENQETPEERLKREEAKLLEALNAKKLLSHAELAKGVTFTESMKTSWRPPHHVRELSPQDHKVIREKWHILVDGQEVPAPIKSFKDMRLPPSLLDYLKHKNIMRPTPIQIQGLPVALSGRDMIGIAATGSGKSLVFCVPMVLFSLEAEIKVPFIEKESALALAVVPSRELARQIYENCMELCAALSREGFPEIRPLLCTGGINMADQSNYLRKGVHIVVATPGRLKDMLDKKKLNLDACRMLVLDEADRMVNPGFEEEVREILSFYKQQRQTLLFSATMPKKVQEFAKTALIQPIVVNVGRAGAANLDVIQEIEFVKEEAKIVYLLECLQKTPPPVLIFAENKNDVDDIHEYLLLKGVEAVAIHGGKDQEEREFAIRAFKTCKKDVLVATDVASKGLDFPNIQHVINFDMPKEIEDYVHRIGRTGRCGKTGVATTFVNRKSCTDQILLDLRHLLREAKQRVPPFLDDIQDFAENMAMDGPDKGCAYCGGLGHRIAQCPKLEAQRAKEHGAIRAAHGGGRGGGEM